MYQLKLGEHRAASGSMLLLYDVIRQLWLTGAQGGLGHTSGEVPNARWLLHYVKYGLSISARHDTQQPNAQCRGCADQLQICLAVLQHEQCPF